MKKAESTISKYDRDGVISFTHTNRENTYQTFEMDKKEVGLADLFKGDNLYGKQMRLEYETWKEMNVDAAEDITQADYQMAILNTRAFGYESIRDTQESKEFWVNIAAIVVIVGAALVFPPAGIALGAVYGAAELTSAVTGKDWVSGRELGTGERWFRGALAPLDILPGAAAVKNFSSVASISSFTGKLDILGKTTTLANKTQSSLQKVSDLALTAKTETIARLKQADAFIIKKEKEVLKKVVDGALGTARAVDETLANVQNGFSIFNKGPEFVTAGVNFKGTSTPIPNIKNTIRDRLSMIEGLNIGGSRVPNSKGKFSFDSTSEMKGFKQQISTELKRHNLSLEKFNDLRLKSVSELTSAELKMMKQIRDAVPPITKDTLLQKTIPIQDIERYLSGEFREIGGYVAKVEDVANIKKYDDVVESSRLDYTTWDGTRPYPEGGDSYAMIRFKTPEVDKIAVPYGEKFGGINTDGPPCTLNGFTGARNGEIIPEWEFTGRFEPQNGAELYKVINGKEQLMGIFDQGRFRPIQ